MNGLGQSDSKASAEPAGRASVVDYLERQLLGPIGGESESLTGDAPHKRYLTGILFPLETPPEPDDIDDGTGAISGEDTAEDPIALAGQVQPSSVGVSFVVDRGTPIRVEIEAGRYSKDGAAWTRTPITLTGTNAVEMAPQETVREILDRTASVNAVWRDLGTHTLVTISLVNRIHRSVRGGIGGDDCLLQVSLRCIPVRGTVRPYPTSSSLSSDPEEEELNLLYRKVPTFAVGHGAAAVWGPGTTAGVPWVGTSFLPREQVPAVILDLEADQGPVLSLANLAQLQSRVDVVLADLTAFVDRYRAWLGQLKQSALSLPLANRPAAERLLGRVDLTLSRMERGLQLLAADPQVRLAFAEANRAMLMQMVRSGPDYAGSRRTVHATEQPQPDYTDPKREWRPFQLAFLLTSLESSADENSPDRELVDLIWFPTGGGKTEAYLALAAFTILLRRLRGGDRAAGTTVLTRYTLRLLTAQQFQRAATLVCACEVIRRERPDLFGTVPISIGLWVGGKNTPNTFAQSVDLVTKILDRVWTPLSFQVDLCPWCGTEVVPDAPDEDTLGIRATNTSVRIHCPNRSCDFHEHLPVASVDEEIYKNPPTVLVGTVDKFARFAWDERAGSILGAGVTPGPSLVIQDEFHLISGALGTIIGAYEAGFDSVMKARGLVPKIVASTATIRRAEMQSRGIFGRTVSLFPPAGLDADDSYWVRFDRNGIGRQYVGVMPQGHTPLTAMVHLSAALLQAPMELELDESDRDAYWTLIAYHNSLRELGKSVTLAHDDIPSRIEVIAETEDGQRTLPDDSIVELTSNVPSVEIPGRIETLKKHCGEVGAASFVASSNMISVGVDVSRLGLMVVVGQPKTTSEYIQASSRVGRASPGLVVTLLSPTKPRDRSHFEGFVPYHRTLYRSVEPTSVTPFSAPARARALHAALVILARHAGGYGGVKDADRFDPTSPEWQTLRAEFLSRAGIADPEELDAVTAEVLELEAEWLDLQHRARPSGGLAYESSGKSHLGLLRRFNRPGVGWQTLDSMRNVDVDTRMAVRGAK